jgi:predicted transposase/invertase (TIGR01784 family)
MKKQTHVRFDWAIKKILRSKANFGILEGFLSELLGKDIKILELIESESNRETQNDKSNRVDINVKDSNGELFIVEIQNTRELDYFYRILYNTSKAIAENIYKGMAYKETKKIITVSVVYFDLGQGLDYIYHGLTKFRGIHRNDELQLSDVQRKLFNRTSVESLFPDHYIIKVNDFDDIARDSLDEWVYFLKNSEIKDEFKAKGLAEAREKLKEINMSPSERAAYNRYMDDLSLEASLAETIKFEEQYAMEKGMEKGIEIGAKNKTLELARKMKENGDALDYICKITGLDMKIVNTL